MRTSKDNAREREREIVELEREKWSCFGGNMNESFERAFHIM
jgi:hypothetical protein